MSTNEPKAVSSIAENIPPEESVINSFFEEINQFEEEFPPINRYFDARLEIENAFKRYLNTKDKQKYNEERENIKRLYLIQKVALGKTKELLEELPLQEIYDKNAYLKILHEMRKRYHFTNEQVSEFEYFIDYYISYHQSIQYYFEHECNSDPKIVFWKFFKLDLDQFPDVQVKIGPFGFEFLANVDTIRQIEGGT